MYHCKLSGTLVICVVKSALNVFICINTEFPGESLLINFFFFKNQCTNSEVLSFLRHQFYLVTKPELDSG